MASENASVTLTLFKGPITHTVRGLTFRQNEPQHLAINEANADIIERLKMDPNFRYEGPSKKAKKKASAPPPPPEDTDTDEGEDEESEEETDEGSDEEDSEESESKSEEVSRASLRGLKKRELLKIAKKLKVKGVDASMSRTVIVDAIIETQAPKASKG